MSSLARTYARSFFEAARGKSSAEAGKLALNFLALLRRNGHLKLAGKVLAEVGRMEEGREESARAVSARPLDTGIRTTLQARLKKAGYSLNEKIDTRVIGGVALFLGSSILIDGTIRGKLERLFK